MNNPNFLIEFIQNDINCSYGYKKVFLSDEINDIDIDFKYSIVIESYNYYFLDNKMLDKPKFIIIDNILLTKSLCFKAVFIFENNTDLILQND